jgi:hypothetical protein
LTLKHNAGLSFNIDRNNWGVIGALTRLAI